MGTVWEKLLPSSPRGPTGAPSAPLPQPNDREGVGLYADFTDCLDSYKGHAMLGIGLLTVPLSIYKKSVTPLVVGTILGIVPEILYANWRCNEEYQRFKRHLAATLKDQGVPLNTAGKGRPAG